MSVRSLIGKIPYISGCQDPDRFAERNLMIYDLEVGNKESAFAYRESDSTLNRLAVLEIPEEYVGDPRKYRYAMDRLKIAMLTQDKRKERITPEQEAELDFLAEIHSSGTLSEEIEAELSVEAAVQGVWL